MSPWRSRNTKGSAPTGGRPGAIARRFSGLEERLASPLGAAAIAAGSILVPIASVRAAVPDGDPAPVQFATAPADRGLVVSAHPLASAVGADILGRGGNAADAAIATTLAISVVEPFSAGLGGGGFLLQFDGTSGEMAALDFRERAPQAATASTYRDGNGNPQPRASLDGHRAAAVPGTVAGLAAFHDRAGFLPWADLVAPAIALAETGFAVDERFVRRAAWRARILTANPAARAIFTRDGAPLAPGDRLVQRDLAATLRAIAADPQAFYTGPIADAIAADMAANGGLVTRADLAAYGPRWREPLCGIFRVYRVCSMPPPSSGGVHLLQLLALLRPYELDALDPAGPDYLHLLAESMKIAYADRARWLGDPGFFPVPVRGLVSERYADARRSELDRDRARPADEVLPGDADALAEFSARPDFPDTSHLTVVDGEGSAVSLTFTVNGPFGAGVVAAGTGVVLNNEMDDFAIAPGQPNLFGLVGVEANAIAPGKTPLSSMTPTLAVTAIGEPELRLALGSPGGSRIITTVLQLTVNILGRDMPVDRALAFPRIHHQWLPDRLSVEDRPVGSPEFGDRAPGDPWPPGTLDALEAKGHALDRRRPWGNANAIRVRPDGTLAGAADPRGGGSVAVPPAP